MTLIERMKEAATKAAWPPDGSMPEDLDAWEKASLAFSDDENLAENVLALIQALEVAERALVEAAAYLDGVGANAAASRARQALSHIKTLTAEKENGDG